MKTVNWRTCFASGFPAEPFAARLNMHDIPETIYRAIMNAPANMRAISVSTDIGPSGIVAAERAARRKGIRILWRNHVKLMRAKTREPLNACAPT